MHFNHSLLRRAAFMTALAAPLILSACAPMAAGVSGYDNFIHESATVVRTGTRPAAEAANCFENNGVFLPLSEFSRDGANASFTYRLRVAGVWYEQVQITGEGTGSRAEIRTSPRLNDKWKADFERDRVAAVKRCMNAAG